ncbi:glycosyltransferase family 4 protein [Candidatus Micrarchaeota archaeon]|nr:glycosyltransferase family 4 protein [Candidatus Micrarchaeota archaeon]
MKLLITTPFLETRGGMERVVLKIAQHFKAKIHCISYDAANTFEEFMKMDIDIAKPGWLRSMPVGRRVSTAVEAGWHYYTAKLSDYDVINAHQTPSEWIRNKNSPVIWYCHTPNREAFDLYEWRQKRRNPLSRAIFWATIQPFKFLEYRTVPKIEHIFTNSRNSQERITKYLRRSSEVLHPGVDLEKFSHKSYDRYFLYPSRIAPEKELEYAIEAFKLFSNRQNPKPGAAKPEKNWKLIITGALSKRPEHKAYLKKMQSICPPEVEIRTNVGDWELRDLYSRCTAVLYTPVNEDYGLVPLEAMASGKPCIARNEGGPRETIHDGRDGFLINSIWEMAGKMEFLANDTERCAQMGKEGRAKVERDFTWETFLKRFEEKAEELVRQKARA